MPRLDSTDFETWKREVDKAMVQKFAIDATDAGLDADELLKHWQQEPSAAEFVTWYGEKYDLTPLARLELARCQIQDLKMFSR